MIKAFLAASIGLAVSVGSAAAQCTVTYPHMLSNGTNADANQVMANFNGILTCARFTDNVGIGTTTPPYRLTVQSGGDAQIGLSNSSGVLKAYIGTAGIDGSLPTDALGIRGDAGILFSVLGSPKAIINSAGNVGIATTTPARRFDVNGAAGGTEAWISPSDDRLKMDVRQIPEALDMVKRLRGVRYQWRPAGDREVGKTLSLPTDETQIGFIAQEVEAVVPQAVVAPPKGAQDGVYGLQATNLLPVLVEAIKEQQAQIESLTREIAALKAPKLAVLPTSVSVSADSGR